MKEMVVARAGGRRQSLISWWPVAAAVVAVLVAAVLVLRPSSSANGLVGKAAPEIVLRDVAGKTVRLTALKGHPVLVNFWGVNCLPCRRELPVLQRASQRYSRQGLIVLGIDEQLDDAKSVKLFASEHGATYRMVLDPSSSAMRPYKLDALPRSFLVDRQGVVRADEISPFLDDATLDKALAVIL